MSKRMVFAFFFFSFVLGVKKYTRLWENRILNALMVYAISFAQVNRRCTNYARRIRIVSRWNHWNCLPMITFIFPWTLFSTNVNTVNLKCFSLFFNLKYKKKKITIMGHLWTTIWSLICTFNTQCSVKNVGSERRIYICLKLPRNLLKTNESGSGCLNRERLRKTIKCFRQTAKARTGCPSRGDLSSYGRRDTSVTTDDGFRKRSHSYLAFRNGGSFRSPWTRD